MSSDVALRAINVGKRYRIRHDERRATATEQALQRLRHPFRRTTAGVFEALSQIDLEVRHGETLGLIGRNGAGKSTLLKVLSRITPPTSGRVEVFGRIGSLLEVGTGFHPELTGRENIYLNGAILGMSRRQVDRLFDQIVDFAEVQRFLDVPVKRYSSGMHVRLAFAVAAHLETDVLLIDEVLAVGDAAFQRKCFDTFDSATSSGRAIVLVSHQLPTVASVCTRAVLIRNGRVAADGPPEGVLAQYTVQDTHLGAEYALDDSRRRTSAQFEWVRVDAPLQDPRAIRVFRWHVANVPDTSYNLSISFEIFSSTGQRVVFVDSRLNADPLYRTGRLEVRSPWLGPGIYTMNVYLCDTGGILDAVVDELQFAVSEQLPYSGVILPGVTATGPIADFSFARDIESEGPETSHAGARRL